ncbi:MAG TPA: ATPase, T2SS/T4P/T4SS family [Dehalococcoidales bacterium]|nr:ATPase, T2SS/T4P/T4SS family [Dehalococcoidales bacterium]
MTIASQKSGASLGDSLVKMQIITAGQLQSALRLQKERGEKLSEILISEGSVRAEDLASFLSIEWNIPLIDLKAHVVQPEALQLIPEKMARQHMLVPLNIIGDALVVVMAEPDDYRAIADVFTLTGMKIEVAFANAADIRRAIDIYYRSTEEIQNKVTEYSPAKPSGAKAHTQFDVDTPITKSLDLLIEQAARDRASDIHLEPQGDKLRIRYRIDGILHDVNTLPISAHAELTSRIKILAELDVARSRQAQDGQFSVNIGGNNIDIRVATTSTIYGERITLRLLDKSLSLFTLPELGMMPEPLKKFRSLIKYPFGMILVGGPTGSGKTTTLYTSLNELDHKKHNIMTIEDPVEYQFEDISQSQVDPKAGITFAGGLRAMLRQDPDIILVGEIRDKDTAVTAVQAAMTGHLVFSSIHANDAISMLPRLIDLGVEPSLVATILVVNVAQRMVRRICSNCRTTYAPSAIEQELFRREMGMELQAAYKGTGCHLCGGTGYRGRTGIFEMLDITDGIKDMLAKGASVTELKNLAIAEGMTTMKRDGLLKVKEGITTLEEVSQSLFGLG